MKNSKIWPVLLLTLFSVRIAHGQITPSADAYTNAALPTTNFGTEPVLDVESASQTAYFQFDLSSIPAGYSSANVAKASLKLYVNAVRPGATSMWTSSTARGLRNPSPPTSHPRWVQRLQSVCRNDAYMKAHPYVVEQDKPDFECGYYTLPEIYGAPKEEGIRYAQEQRRKGQEQRNKTTLPVKVQK